MGRNSAEERLEHSEEEEEEEEALSLCDLPVILNKDESKSSKEEIRETEDFDFEPLGGCVSSRSEMCAADDIFFKGQILPFRLSVSSENGLNNCKEEKNLNPSRCLSRSESMDHSSVGGFTSFSSRSSSSRSQFSSSSSVNTTATTTTPTSKVRTQNQFFTQSSPKPQIRIPSTSLGNAATNRNIRKSTVWEFFRVGLVRTPEIELQDLKARNSVSRNSSSSSSSNSNNTSIKISSSGGCSTSRGKKMEKQRIQSFLEKRLLLSGCNCTVNSVKPVPLNIISIKSNNGKNEENEKQIKKKNYKKKMVEKKKEQQQQQGRKQAVSRHRTFEWIKELSYSSFLDQEEGHSLLA